MATMTKSAIGRVKADGSTRQGAHHFIVQRMTSIALVPLSLWFIVGAVGLSGATYEDVRAWLSGPFNATAMILLIVCLFWHAQLGAQVIIEDYVHQEALKIGSLMLLNLAAIALGTACVVSVLMISLGS